jgi:hypothetical protein
MRPRRIVPLVVIAASCIAASESRAPLWGYSPWKQSESVWRLMDLCRRNALKQFPNYTPEDNAKRERAERQCQQANNLPYVSPQSPQASGGSSQR